MTTARSSMKRNASMPDLNAWRARCRSCRSASQPQHLPKHLQQHPSEQPLRLEPQGPKLQHPPKQPPKDPIPQIMKRCLNDTAICRNAIKIWAASRIKVRCAAYCQVWLLMRNTTTRRSAHCPEEREQGWRLRASLWKSRTSCFWTSRRTTSTSGC